MKSAVLVLAICIAALASPAIAGSSGTSTTCLIFDATCGVDGIAAPIDATLTDMGGGELGLSWNGKIDYPGYLREKQSSTCFFHVGSKLLTCGGHQTDNYGILITPHGHVAVRATFTD